MAKIQNIALAIEVEVIMVASRRKTVDVTEGIALELDRRLGDLSSSIDAVKKGLV